MEGEDKAKASVSESPRKIVKPSKENLGADPAEPREVPAMSPPQDKISKTAKLSGAEASPREKSSPKPAKNTSPSETPKVITADSIAADYPIKSSPGNDGPVDINAVFIQPVDEQTFKEGNLERKWGNIKEVLPVYMFSFVENMVKEERRRRIEVTRCFLALEKELREQNSSFLANFLKHEFGPDVVTKEVSSDYEYHCRMPLEVSEVTSLKSTNSWLVAKNMEATARIIEGKSFTGNRLSPSRCSKTELDRKAKQQKRKRSLSTKRGKGAEQGRKRKALSPPSFSGNSDDDGDCSDASEQVNKKSESDSSESEEPESEADEGEESSSEKEIRRIVEEDLNYKMVQEQLKNPRGKLPATPKGMVLRKICLERGCHYAEKKSQGNMQKHIKSVHPNEDLIAQAGVWVFMTEKQEIKRRSRWANQIAVENQEKRLKKRAAELEYEEEKMKKKAHSKRARK